MKVQFRLRAILLLIVPICILLACIASVVDGNWDAFASGWHGSVLAYRGKPGARAEQLGEFLHFVTYVIWGAGGLLLLGFCVLNLFMDRGSPDSE